MDKVKELKFRCSLALDFLYRSMQDVPTECSLELNLKSISLLYFCGNFFYRNELNDLSSRMFDEVLEYRFDHNEYACIVKNDQSHVSWNLKVASIYLRNRQELDAIKFLNTLENSIVGNLKVNFFYIPGTHNEILSKSPDVNGSLGELGLTLLFANRYIEKYDKEIERIFGIILKHGRFDPLDIWFTRLWNDQKENPNCKLFSDHIINRMNSIAVASMSGLAAAVVQQSNLAWSDKKDRIEQILEYQLSLQDLHTGAFRRSASDNEARLDYTVHNIIAILLYLSRIEGEKMDVLSLLS